MEKQRSITIKTLIENLTNQQLISADQEQNIYNYLEQEPNNEKSPFYINILIGTGAWIAAFFIIAFLGLSQIITSEAGSFIVGIIFILSAVMLSRTQNSIFLNQLALAFTISGQSLVIFSLVQSQVDVLLSLAFFHCLTTLIIYPFFKNNVYRFIAPYSLGIILLISFMEKNYLYAKDALILIQAVLTITMALIFKLPACVKPLKYAMAASFPTTVLIINLASMDLIKIQAQYIIQPTNIGITLSLIAVIIYISGGIQNIKKPGILFAIAGVSIGGFFTSIGISSALILLVLGFYSDDKFMYFLSYLFLPVFLITFYYSLNISLLHKSLIIGTTGIIMLCCAKAIDLFFIGRTKI